MCLILILFINVRVRLVDHPDTHYLQYVMCFRLSALNVDKLQSTSRILFLIDSWWTSVKAFSDISLNANNCFSADRTCHDEYYLSKCNSQRETQTRLSWWLSLLDGVTRNIHSTTTYYWCSLQNKVLRVNSALSVQLIPAFRSARTSNWDVML